mmetsp:Transcript_10324/g.31579  ORF Transcript_10324/g.31579 Transcript_10324/m.31579 type:complete len:119 (+) Transcript_10324:71-427(+)|eukprot:CAMPEP_0198728230 /NCGR_PEP_ID=MMETSP1475-20131203/8096_1 /TAXON_ID= ORGANISM="Unidentified sp., Strain CCMP1999" /NCGR_SAMPLE_ID=MMETSP1475 /ASSEMBLY_ACC=CAM_ASM_001111 /LENGTH=118 /DNA_ID=CAMNT_0044490541 /DNA_START=66 /DNA_END=422 /DNA_ORIENTATION=+
MDKDLKAYVRGARQRLSSAKESVKHSLEKPVDRVERFVSTADAHFGDGIKRLVSMRHKVDPIFVMMGSAMLVALPLVKLSGPGTALRLGTMTLALTGVIGYPDYVTQKVDQITNRDLD